MVVLVLGHGVVLLDEDIPRGLVPLEAEFHELCVKRRTHHIASCTKKNSGIINTKPGKSEQDASWPSP